MAAVSIHDLFITIEGIEKQPTPSRRAATPLRKPEYYPHLHKVKGQGGKGLTQERGKGEGINVCINGVACSAFLLFYRFR